MNDTRPDARRCPICGQPNDCAALTDGGSAADCWCRGVAFTQALLARVPPDLEGKACICRRCAEETHDDRTLPGSQG